MKKQYLINRQGKDFVLFEGLLDEAHQKGLKRITTKLLQVPGPDNGNTAICWAEVEVERGVFSGIGDANPGNVNKMIQPHLIRMAETRAKARALRDAINVGQTSMEELTDGELEPQVGEPQHETERSNDDDRPNLSLVGAAQARKNQGHPSVLQTECRDALNALCDRTGRTLEDVAAEGMAACGLTNAKNDAARQKLIDWANAQPATLTDLPFDVPTRSQEF